MAVVDTLTQEIETILDTAWDSREGTIIPATESVKLKDGAVAIEATFLYADLAGSSQLAQSCPWETTAKIIRAYLNCATRLIKNYGGEIRSFDGDRVMGVFVGDSKNNSAVRCALAINWVVADVINPKAKQKYKSIRDNEIEIRHCIGIDTGKCRAVRAGIRSNNDLIWIGAAPSFAAKLSDVREFPYSTYISSAVYNALTDLNKMNGSANMWELRTTSFAGKTKNVYRSNYKWEP